MAIKKISDYERMLLSVEYEPTSGCWIWCGKTVSTRGHGRISVGTTAKHSDKLEYVHRLSWVHHFGDIPAGLHVRHKCDVPCCVNPDHLLLGVNQDNQLDKAARGRGRKSKSGLPFGVCKAGSAYQAAIRHRGEAIYLGRFTSVDQAAEVAKKTKSQLLKLGDE